MRRQAVLISRKYEMYLPSQSTVPPATDCWLSNRPIVSKEIRPSRPLPYGGTLMAQFAQRRFLPENAVSYGHWFSTSHSSTMCRRLITEKSYRCPRGRVLRLPDHLPRRPSNPRRGLLTSGSATFVYPGKTARRSWSALAGVARELR